MSKFKEKARSAVSNSFVTSGRTKVSTDDIISRFPEGVTIMAYDKCQKGDDSFYAIAIKEDPDVFFFTGSVLTTICKEWDSGFDGSCEEASKALEEEGGCRVKMYHAKSQKSNRDYVAIDILD